MPPLPVSPYTLKTELLWEYGDKAAANVLHYAYEPNGPVSADFASAVANSVELQVAAEAAQWGADVTFVGVRVTDLSSDVGPVVEAPGAVIGTREGTTLPANSAVLAQYTTPRRYRGGHPRQYLPWGVAEDLDTPQTWTDGAVSTFTDAWSSIAGSALGIALGGFTTTEQVSVSYYTGGALRITPYLDALTFAGIATEVASMRRRDGRH